MEATPIDHGQLISILVRRASYLPIPEEQVNDDSLDPENWSSVTIGSRLMTMLGIEKTELDYLEDRDNAPLKLATTSVSSGVAGASSSSVFPSNSGDRKSNP